jgi:plastocyanin
VTPFYVVGALAAVWAVILAALGITRDRFPASKGATQAVMAISTLVVVGAVGTAVLGGILEGEHEEEPEEAVASEAPEEAAGEELELAAEPSGDLAFEPAELEAEAGPVTLTMENPSPIDHNVSLEGPSVDEEGETVGQGGTSTVTAEVKRGDYTFYCSVSGHREGGMEGTLMVE